MTESLPSIKQMVNRANSGHLKVLKAYRDQTTLDTPGTPLSSLRGYMTCSRTLRFWECVVDGQLTDRGIELLDALETRWSK